MKASNTMWVEASAPSNIALIKYMGKVDSTVNRPTNSSLSYTLDRLRTFVRIEIDDSLTADSWSSYMRNDLMAINLSEKGREKFLKHFQFLKNQFSIKGNFKIESANNFPSDCGLASSASSFAALTMVAYQFALQNKTISHDFSASELAALSQKGSGSSCRSFFSPWAQWGSDEVHAVDLPYTYLKHQVLLCDEQIKLISSSEAHKKVLSSDMFEGRVERARVRLSKLTHALQSSRWSEAFEITWNEFWDMHTLFHTSKPPFQYMNGMSLDALNALHNIWKKNSDGPLVTMDAGSNIHLLYRPEQKSIYFEVINEFRGRMPIWTDEGYLAKLS